MPHKPEGTPKGGGPPKGDSSTRRGFQISMLNCKEHLRVQCVDEESDKSLAKPHPQIYGPGTFGQV